MSQYIFITKEKADSVKGILRWIADAAPRKREREQAKRILASLSAVRPGGSRQILLTEGEAEMLRFIDETYPDGIIGDYQLQLPL